MPTFVGTPEKHFLFPINNDCLVALRFSQHQRMDGSLIGKDALIDHSTMGKFCSDIISMVRLERSPES